jgi:DNA-directed RNA polymerase subunit RPC12/RpoP
MSRVTQEQISCPECSYNQLFQIYHSVNVTINPELKEELINRELTTFKCSKCSKMFYLRYDLLYHDVNRHLLIWLKYPNEKGLINFEDGSFDIPPFLADHYKTRIVYSLPELIEKITIFDDDFDDLGIELMKLLVCFREGIDITTPFVYCGLKKKLIGEDLVAFIIRINDDLIEAKYPFKEIFTLPSLIKLREYQTKQKVPWEHVDREYVIKLLTESGLAQNIY